MTRKLLTIILALQALAAMAQTLHFRQLTVKDGLPHNSIITLAQDAKGDIWVATHGGLLRYDGRQFHKLPFEELPDKRVDRMNCASDGTMWVQCFECHEQVSRYDTLTHHFVTYNVSELSDSLHVQAVQSLNRTFADPHSSRVWTIKKRQLWQSDTLRPGTEFAYTSQKANSAGLKDEIFYSLLLDRQGILWAGSANNGLFFADTRQSYYYRLLCQPSPMVRATCKDSRGTLWIAIGDQQLLMLAKATNMTVPVDYPMTDSVEGRRIRAIIEDGKQRIWLGTHDGLYVKDAPSAAFRRVALDTREVGVYGLCNDNNKLLWVGTDRGLYRLALDHQQLQAQLVDSTVTSISHIATGEKGLWLSSEKGLYYRTDGKMVLWSKIPTHSITTDPTGQIWVGTDDGLMRVTEQGVQPVSTAADGHTVKNLICWREFLWCSHEQGLCCVNIYTGRSTILHTEHNEYLDGSACMDPQTNTIYFGGTLGIDCLVADRLDEKLRSGISQLWLEEVNEELKIKGEETTPSSKPYWLIALLAAFIACGARAYIYYRRKQKKTPPEETEQPLPKEPSPFILKATAIAEAHMADTDFTAEVMAQEMAMSRSKLFLLMKKEAGKAVMEFVRDIRLDYAAQQLAAGVPVADITMACGFSDPSSFRRSFVKKFGVNPSQYRERLRLS